jgi:hypothetical protein
MLEDRRAFLKGYLFSLLSEGAFAGMVSPASMAKKAVAIFATDLPVVLGDIAEMAAANGTSKIASAVLGKMNDVVRDIDKRGIKAVWGDIKAQYDRGVDANAERRGSR